MLAIYKVIDKIKNSLTKDSQKEQPRKQEFHLINEKHQQVVDPKIKQRLSHIKSHLSDDVSIFYEARTFNEPASYLVGSRFRSSFVLWAAARNLRIGKTVGYFVERPADENKVREIALQLERLGAIEIQKTYGGGGKFIIKDDTLLGMNWAIGFALIACKRAFMGAPFSVLAPAWTGRDGHKTFWHAVFALDGSLGAMLVVPGPLDDNRCKKMIKEAKDVGFDLSRVVIAFLPSTKNQESMDYLYDAGFVVCDIADAERELRNIRHAKSRMYRRRSAIAT